MLKFYLEQLLQDVVIHTEYADRKTVSIHDVFAAFNHRGNYSPIHLFQRARTRGNVPSDSQVQGSGSPTSTPVAVDLSATAHHCSLAHLSFAEFTYSLSRSFAGYSTGLPLPLSEIIKQQQQLKQCALAMTQFDHIFDEGGATFGSSHYPRLLDPPSWDEDTHVVSASVDQYELRCKAFGVWLYARTQCAEHAQDMPQYIWCKILSHLTRSDALPSFLAANAGLIEPAMQDSLSRPAKTVEFQPLADNVTAETRPRNGCHFRHGSWRKVSGGHVFEHHGPSVNVVVRWISPHGRVIPQSRLSSRGPISGWQLISSLQVLTAAVNRTSFKTSCSACCISCLCPMCRRKGWPLCTKS